MKLSDWSSLLFFVSQKSKNPKFAFEIFTGYYSVGWNWWASLRYWVCKLLKVLYRVHLRAHILYICSRAKLFYPPRNYKEFLFYLTIEKIHVFLKSSFESLYSQNICRSAFFVKDFNHTVGELQLNLDVINNWEILLSNLFFAPSYHHLDREEKTGSPFVWMHIKKLDIPLKRIWGNRLVSHIGFLSLDYMCRNLPFYSCCTWTLKEQIVLWRKVYAFLNRIIAIFKIIGVRISVSRWHTYLLAFVLKKMNSMHACKQDQLFPVPTFLTLPYNWLLDTFLFFSQTDFRYYLHVTFTKHILFNRNGIASASPLIRVDLFRNHVRGKWS